MYNISFLDFLVINSKHTDLAMIRINKQKRKVNLCFLLKKMDVSWGFDRTLGRQEDLDFIDDLYIFPSAICLAGFLIIEIGNFQNLNAICLAGFLIIEIGNFQNLNLNKVTPSIDKFYIDVSGFSLHKFRMLWVHLSHWNVLQMHW